MGGVHAPSGRALSPLLCLSGRLDTRRARGTSPRCLTASLQAMLGTVWPAGPMGPVKSFGLVLPKPPQRGPGGQSLCSRLISKLIILCGARMVL